MAILSTAKIVGMLVSAKKTGKQILNATGEYVAEVVEDFVSGFMGHGWKIWEYVKGLWRLEIDSIVVRGTMTVFELLIQKIRAIKGALGITQACGKIKTADLDTGGENWLITIEDEMSFVAHDIIRCQNWTGNGIKGYWVEISEIRKVDGIDTIVIPVNEFTGGIGYVDGMEAVKPDLSGMTTPAEGDEIIQFGNSQNTNRQSAIYLHADEGGQPAIDILFGINSKSFYGCVKMRVGGDIPGADGLKGFYCENGMIKGTDTSGHVVYCIHPDGSAEFGDGSAKFNTNKSGHIAGGAISWEWSEEKNMFICTMGEGVIIKWDNLDDETKENLKGESGIGIKETDVEYAISTSNTTSPTTGWQTTSPIWVDGKYIWSRTRIVYTDDSVIYTSAVCITGGKGASGDEGKGVSSIVEQYYLSSSSSSLTGGAWSTERPTWKNGWYIWTRSVITYTDDTSTTTEAICVTGEKGNDGIGISSSDVEYAKSSSSYIVPTTGWQTTAPTWENGKYIWSRTKVVYTDNSIKYTSAVCITGGKGTSGDDGKGIQSIIEQYYLSYSSSSLVGGGWQNSSPTWKNGWYIWTHSVITYTDNTNTTTEAICVTGGKGEDAVMYVIEFYIQGLQVHNIACDIHSKPVGGNLLIAKLYRIKGNSKELYSAGNWIVNHILNGTEVSDIDSSSPRSSVSINITNVGDFDSISVGVAGGYSPDDPVISASGIIAKVMANVPEWLTGWDTNKVQIGSTYMISPKLFTGVNTGTAEEPILTGIVQGDKCITIDDVERSGIFALVENEIIFELDAKNGSGSLAKGTTSWDKFGQTYRKTRDIIVWRRLSDEMQAILDKIEDPEEERPDEYDLNLEYGTYLMAHNPTLNFFVNLPDPAECKGLILDVYDMPRTRALIYWAKFRCKISPILRRNSTGAYEAVVVSDPGRKEFGSSIIQSVQYNDSWRWIADSSFEVVNSN
ncbi:MULTISPECIES: hypothetical protein [Bacteroides]|jgi:hypothetical protein|uniref:hypothetical protein n=1 Tax=Bacteroides TaxID=816 RepID=UPI001D08462D|nr:hypothetical protein [Bacteroides cellulosilyticus]MCB6271545.1 hypothetical protein [Bacteroides cellulosilyticus]MCG4971536.1 hypothetical protein [Bacteroides cellulosilyticus]